LTENFFHFRMENRNFDKTVSSDLQARSSKSLHPSAVISVEKIRSYLDQVVNRFREEYGYHQMNIFLSENAVHHIIRIHRILAFNQWYFF
jgi:hypothetical protein